MWGLIEPHLGPAGVANWVVDVVVADSITSLHVRLKFVRHPPDPEALYYKDRRQQRFTYGLLMLLFALSSGCPRIGRIAGPVLAKWGGPCCQAGKSSGRWRHMPAV